MTTSAETIATTTDPVASRRAGSRCGPPRTADFPPRLLFREGIADYAIRDALLRQAQHILGRVLDLGCGDRRYERVFGPSATSWIGVDWPGNPHSAGPQVVGDAMRLPFAQGSFDTVLCTQVLEHVPQPQALLAEAHRVLKAGGRLVLTAPQYNGLHEAPRDFYRYTRYGLEHLLGSAGFDVQQIEPIGGFLALFAFITTLHVAPLRSPAIRGLWQWLAWRLDAVWFRPNDCIGNIAIAVRPR